MIVKSKNTEYDITDTVIWRKPDKGILEYLSIQSKVYRENGITVYKVFTPSIYEEQKIIANYHTGKITFVVGKRLEIVESIESITY